MKGNLPLYLQVKESLSEEIRRGGRVVGEKLPPEMALCRSYGVSRVTMRQAMEQLRAEGLIERFAGRGTFVSNDRAKMPTKKVWKVIIPKIALYHPVLAAIEDFAHHQGYDIMFAGPTADDFPIHVERGRENGVVGYFFTPPFSPFLDSSDDRKIMAVLYELRAKRVPVVLVNRLLKRYRFDAVGEDNCRGGFLATSHLLEHGYKRIAYFGSSGHFVNPLRRQGYLDALRKYGVKQPIIGEMPPDSEDDGYSDARELLTRGKPDAIFAIGDSLAMQVFRAAADLGMTIPEDLALIGHDNFNDLFVPPVGLTSVDQRLSLIAETAVKILLKRLEGDWSDFNRRIMVEPSLVVHRSCGCREEGR